jgi:iron-sulfur cluster assembly accessory protein
MMADTNIINPSEENLITDEHLLFTKSAIDRINEVFTSSQKAITLSVQGGGCYGFSYKFNSSDLDTEKLNPDLELYLKNNDNIVFILDKKSLPFIKGSTVDYSSDDFSGFFKLYF